MTTIVKQSEDVIQDTKKYIINEYSYLGVSMSDIAKKLNITKAALYYHFAGKTEIYEKVLDNVFTDLSLVINQALNEPTIDKKLYKLIKNYLDFGSKEKNLIKALMLRLSPEDSQTTKHIVQLREQIISLIYPIIDEVSISKKLTKKVDSLILTFLNKKINSAKISDQIIAILF